MLVCVLELLVHSYFLPIHCATFLLLLRLGELLCALVSSVFCLVYLSGVSMRSRNLRAYLLLVHPLRLVSAPRAATSALLAISRANGVISTV